MALCALGRVLSWGASDVLSLLLVFSVLVVTIKEKKKNLQFSLISINQNGPS